MNLTLYLHTCCNSIRWRTLVRTTLYLNVWAICLFPVHAGENEESRIAKVIRHATPAFAFVGHAKGNGSGAVVSKDGHIITNHHVCGNETNLLVRLGTGQSFMAKMVGRNRQGDIALLKIESDQPLHFLELADSDRLRVGDLCVAIGNPVALGALDQTPTVTTGVISGLNQFKGGGIYNNAIVTDAPINPGNSGGPLLNMDGEIVGINGLTETRLGLRSNSGLGYAIPSNQIRLWLPLLSDPDKLDVYRGRFLGVSLETENEKTPDKGVLVSEVVAESDAAQAGLKSGDIVIRVQGLDVWHAARFMGILNMMPAGTKLHMEVERDGKKLNLSYLMPERKPADFGFVVETPDMKDQELRVKSVEKDSAAARAGLQAGDIIAAIGDHALAGPAPLQYMVVVERWMPIVVGGAEVRFKILRKVDGKAVEKEIRFNTD